MYSSDGSARDLFSLSSEPKIGQKQAEILISFFELLFY